MSGKKKIFESNFLQVFGGGKTSLKIFICSCRDIGVGYCQPNLWIFWFKTFDLDFGLYNIFNKEIYLTSPDNYWCLGLNQECN